MVIDPWGFRPFVQQRLSVSLRYSIGGSSFLVTNLDGLYLPQLRPLKILLLLLAQFQKLTP